MEKVKAQYGITQKEAIKANRADYGVIALTVDPANLTDAQREELALSDLEDKCLVLDRYANWQLHTVPDQATMMPEQAMIALLDLRIARRAEDLAKREKEATTKAVQREAEIIEILAHPESLIIDRWDASWHTETVGESSATWKPYQRKRCPDDPRIEAILPSVEGKITRMNSERQQDAIARATTTEQDRLAADAAAEALAERKTAQIALWVAEHGTGNQKKRLSVGLLPEKEIIDAIRADAYAPLDGEARYEKMKGADFCACDRDYDSPDYDFDAEDAEDASGEEFDYIEAVQARLPEAKITLRRHTGKCTTCNESLSRASLRIELTVGAFDFSREYAV